MNKQFRQIYITVEQAEKIESLMHLARPTNRLHKPTIHSFSRELLNFALHSLEQNLNEQNAKEPTENEPQRPDSI